MQRRSLKKMLVLEIMSQSVNNNSDNKDDIDKTVEKTSTTLQRSGRLVFADEDRYDADVGRWME